MNIVRIHYMIRLGAECTTIDSRLRKHTSVKLYSLARSTARELAAPTDAIIGKPARIVF